VSRRNSVEGVDTVQQVGEQRCRDGDFGALEDPSSGMTDDPGADLDELELDAPKRPVRDLSRQSGSPDEIAEVVRQHEQGEANLVADKSRAGEPGPGEGQFPLLDLMLSVH